jgi:hypothetical protein
MIVNRQAREAFGDLRTEGLDQQLPLADRTLVADVMAADVQKGRSRS